MIELKFFYEDWSTYCKKESKVLEQLLEIYPNLKITKIHGWKNPELLIRYKIKGVPTAIIEKNGECIDKVVGGGPLSFYTKIIKEIYE